MLEEGKMKSEAWLGAATGVEKALRCCYQLRLQTRLSGPGGYSYLEWPSFEPPPQSLYITAMDIRQQTVFARPADMGPSHCIGRVALCFASPTGAKISTYTPTSANTRLSIPRPLLDILSTPT
jgi:hypothetical protein